MHIGPTNVLQLLQGIRDNRIVLPDLQREFVWSKDQIYLFCDSFFRGYPFGSFLFWRVTGSREPNRTLVYRQFFSTFKEGAELPPPIELSGGDEKLMVLDGQQRLQSIYLAIFGSIDR